MTLPIGFGRRALANQPETPRKIRKNLLSARFIDFRVSLEWNPVRSLELFLVCDKLESYEKGQNNTKRRKTRKTRIQTVLFMTEQGFNIELIPLKLNKGTKTADIKMNNLEWEMKCPRGKGARTIEKLFQKALHQSENLIFDLRHTQLHGDKAKKQTIKQFELRKSAKNLIIITKTGKFLDMKK